MGEEQADTLKHMYVFYLSTLIEEVVTQLSLPGIEIRTQAEYLLEHKSGATIKVGRSSNSSWVCCVVEAPTVEQLDSAREHMVAKMGHKEVGFRPST